MKLEKNKNTKTIIDLIKDVTDKPAGIIAVPAQLIHFIGSVNHAVFLSQLLYWSDKGKRSDGFIFKTKKEWQAEIGLSEYQVTEATKALKAIGILETDVKKANGSPTTHYKLDIEKLCVLIRQFLEKGTTEDLEIKDEVTRESLTDTTSKNTQNYTIRESGLSDDNHNTADIKRNPEYAKDISPPANVREEIENSASLDDESLKKIPVPADYMPSWDVAYRAVTTFEGKSPTEIAKKFRTHYQAKGNKLTKEEWDAKYWGWIWTERISHGSNALMDESNRIINHVLGVVFDLLDESEGYVQNFESLADKLKGKGFSADTVASALQKLIKGEWVATAGDYYFDRRLYETDEDIRDEIDEILNDVGEAYERQPRLRYWDE